MAEVADRSCIMNALQSSYVMQARSATSCRRPINIFWYKVTKDVLASVFDAVSKQFNDITFTPIRDHSKAI